MARGAGFRQVLWVRGGQLRHSTPDTAMVRGARLPLITGSHESPPRDVFFSITQHISLENTDALEW